MKAALLLFLFCLAEADDLRSEVKALFQQLKSNLEGQNADMASRLSASETKIEGLQTRLSDSEKLMEELQKPKADKPQVAFSVGLGGDDVDVGPFSSDTTLVYKTVFTNIGNAYNATGIFTAPVKGVYHFRFTAGAYGRSSEDVSIKMYKNDQMLMWSYGYNDHGNWETISNGMMVELEERDTVYMRLPAGRRLRDSPSNHNIWTGVLVYSM